MSDPQPFAGPLPAVPILVDQFSASITAPGVLKVSSFSHMPVPGAVVAVTGPSFAMSVSNAQALINLLQSLIAQAQSLAAQAGQPN